MTADSKQISLFSIGTVLAWLFEGKSCVRYFWILQTKEKPSLIQVDSLVHTYRWVSPTAINVSWNFRTRLRLSAQLHIFGTLITRAHSSGLIEHATHSRCLCTIAQHISFKDCWHHREVWRCGNLACVRDRQTEWSTQTPQLLLHLWALLPEPSSPPQSHHPEIKAVSSLPELL